MDKKNIAVVTGGTGFVGSHLVDLLLKEGYAVKCITRKSSNLRWLEGKSVEIHDCGLYNKEELKKVLQDADYLFHIAGIVKAKSEEEYFKGNVETTRNLLDVCLEINPNIKRIMVTSSQTAAGPSVGGKTIDETKEMEPLTRYGKSKKAEEEMVRKYMEKLPITIVRPPAVYGERDTEIYLIFRTFKMMRLFTMIGFNKKKVSMIHVTDLVRGMFLAATKEKGKGETYFITSKEFYNWPQIGKIISEAMGKKALFLRLPHWLVYTVAVFAQFFAMFSSKAATFNIEKARDFVQPYWTCSHEKAKKDLGFVQEVSIEEGMKRTIRWYEEMKWL